MPQPRSGSLDAGAPHLPNHDVIKVLDEHGGATTWLAVDRGTGQRLVIRQIDRVASAENLRMRAEHDARHLTNIRRTTAPEVITTSNVVLLLRPYVEGLTLAAEVARSPLSPVQVAKLGRDIAVTLADAHAAGVRHGHLHPHNIVLAAEGPVLVDFAHARMPLLEDTQATSRAAFLAPEQAGLIDADVDERADLYALGNVLYAAASGAAPHESESIHELIRNQLAMATPSLRMKGIVVPRVLDEIIQRLLQSDPRERYQTASAVAADLDALVRALDKGSADPALTLGTHDVRRVLAEPSFVTRPAEMATLRAALERAGRGEGGIVLLEANSGGGKTRLLDELAHEAHAGGTPVLRGQGVDQAARHPFEILRGVTNSLSRLLVTDPARAPTLNDRLGDERDALLHVAPELKRAIGEPTLKDLGPEEHGERRSLGAYHRLFDALGEEGRPILIILDDTQWADAATLKLLLNWSRAETGVSHHVLLVAAFRSEEVDADHVLRKTGRIDHVELRPFDAAQTRALAESMAGKLPTEALDTLTRLAEGSPFMTAAVLRGLVESRALQPTQAGWVVDQARLAEMRSSTEAAAFLTRRLELLPADTLHILSVGALLGKSFDLAMACELAAQPPHLAVPALDLARQRHIIWNRAEAGEYAFVHDKLREALLAMMGADERARLHQHAANKLEQRHGERDFDIAYHYDAANLPELALPYALRAAEYARNHHSLDLAEDNYRIAERGAIQADDDMRKRIAEGLGDVLMLRGRYQEASVAFERASELAHTSIEKANILSKVGELAFKQGNVREASAHLEEALRTLKRPAPTTAFGYLMLVTKEAIVQLFHTLFPSLFLARRSREGADEEFTAIRIYSRLAYAYWFHKGLIACGWAHLKEMNLAERYPESLELAQAYSEHAPVMTMVPFPPRGIDYAKRSYAIRERHGDVWGLGQSLHFHAVVLYAASRYEECLEKSTEAVRHLSRTGDMWETNTALWHIAICHYRLGNTTEAIKRARRVHTAAMELGDAQAAGIALGIWAKATAGRLPEDLVEAARQRGTEDGPTAAEIAMATALIQLRARNPAQACETLREAHAMIRARRLRQEYSAPVLPWLATAIRHHLTAGAHTLDEQRQLTKEGRRVAASAVRLARAYRNNLPHALREQAWFDAYASNHRRAQTRLARSREIALQQGAKSEVAATLAMWRTLAARHAWPAPPTEETEWEDAGDLEAPSSPTLSLQARYGVLLEAGRAIVGKLDEQAVLQATNDAMRDLLRAPTCVILRLDPATGQPVDEESKITEAASVLCERALRSGQTVAYSSDAATGTDDALLATGVRSAIATVVHVRGRPDRLLYAQHQHLAGAFGDDERSICDFIGSLTGAALENSELFAEISSANESLDLQRSLLQRQGEASIDGILVVSPEGRILYSNNRFAQLWGLGPEHTEEDRIALDAVRDRVADPDGFFRRVDEIYASDLPESRDDIQLKDGRVFDRYSAALRTAEGEARARVWFFRDVTEIKAAEAHLRDANERLRQANELKTLLLNTASHELNTPLTPIKMQVYLLEQGRLGALSEKQANAVTVLSRNITRLSQLVQDMLDVSKLQSGRLLIERAPIDVAQLLAEVHASFEASAHQQGITLEVPKPPRGHATIEGDARRLTQVLFNLLNNAMKFTPAGGRVTISFISEVDGHVVRVSDTGPGLTAEQIARLFQPFSQVHDAKLHAKGGTGLGLYISRGIVETHGGRMWCESEGPGRGTTFAFTLPRRLPDPVRNG